MKSKINVLFALICVAGLAACSPQQEQAAINATNVACHVASDAEASDPKLQPKNGGIVAGQTILCALVATQAGAPVPVPVPAPATVVAAPAVNPGELAQ